MWLVFPGATTRCWMKVTRTTTTTKQTPPSLQEKVRGWARATGSMAGPLIERLETLAHRDPAQIAASILAGEEGTQPCRGSGPEEAVPSAEETFGEERASGALRDAEAMELF